MNAAAKIGAIRALRRTTCETLADVLASGSGLTEFDISERWHQRLQAVDGLTEQGWYLPPPHGIIVAIGAPPRYERNCPLSFRPEFTWPNAAHRLTDQSLLFAYASPVERSTGMIGDAGCSLYRGSDARLRAHLANVWNLTKSIQELAEPGMTYAQLYTRAMQLISVAGLANLVDSVHGGSSTDIGHTIPWFTADPTPNERQVLATGTPGEVADLVSIQRTFINPTNHAVIGETSAFTIEPRLAGVGLPMVSFHTVVAFADGAKQVITEFDSLFEQFEMSDIG